MATGSKVVNGPAQIAKKYNYGDVRIMLENCILPKERLYTTPSMRDGLNKEVEIDLRIVGCEYIQVAGILLRLPQVAMATAQVLFQRFYYSKSFVKHEAEVYAMACIFLAAKIEESPRRIRDVINVFHHIKQRRNTRTIAPMEYLGNSYFVLKNQVIKAERRVLKELGFCVHVKHPHKIIVTYLQILECEKNQSLVQRSWNFMNDSLRTNLFVRYDPEQIACACIFLASRQLNICLPTRPPWWDLFNSTRDELEDISVTILELYGRPKAPALDVLQKEVAEIRQKLQEEKDKIKASTGKEKDGTFTPTISPTSTSQQLSRPGSLSGSPTKGSLMAETNGEGQRKKGSGRTGDEKESGAKGSRYEKDSKKVNRSPLVRSRSRSRSHSRSRSRSRTHSRSRSRSRSRGSSYSISISPDSQSLSESESSASDHSPGQRRAERERGRRSPEHRRGGDDRHRHSKYNVSKNDFDRKSHKHKSSAGVSKKSKDRSRDRLRDRSRSPISRSRSRSRERLKDRSRSKHDRDFLKREERKHQRERNSNGADYRSRGKSGRDREHERRRHHR